MVFALLRVVFALLRVILATLRVFLAPLRVYLSEAQKLSIPYYPHPFACRVCDVAFNFLSFVRHSI